MTPIKIFFQSSESLTVYSDDPDAFADSVLSQKPPEIKLLKYDEGTVEAPELAEVKLTLQGGTIILCNIAKAEMAKAQYIEEIIDCDVSNVITYSKMVAQEAELDARFAAASAVINNLPDLDARLYLHREYMKRKQAYVAAIEALVDGAFRRPNQND